jgi:hypothetical protein
MDGEDAGEEEDHVVASPSDLRATAEPEYNASTTPTGLEISTIKRKKWRVEEKEREQGRRER